MGLWRSKFVSIVFLFLMILLFFYSFLSRIWVAEDAYITFRHIQNFLEGYGLTFNINDKIEGFTHPLWVFLLILFSGLGFSLHLSSLLLGVIFTTSGMLILFYNFVYKQNKLNFFYKSFLIIPYYFIIHDGFRDFWTSGMEFSLTFFLLSLFLTYVADKNIQNPFQVSMILSLLYTNRPELGGIFYLYYGLILFLESIKQNSKKNLKIIFSNIILYLIPFLIFAGGYHLFRWFYYSDLFPTTFYAKSSKILWKEGIYYIGYSFFYSPFFLITLLVFIILIFLKKHQTQYKYLIRDMIPVFLHLLYLIFIGGDFMAYRMILPELTILYVYFTLYFSRWIQKESFFVFGNLSLFLISIYYLFVQKIHTPVVGKYQIVHEYKFYENKKQPWKEKWYKIEHKWYQRGEVFKELQKCLEYEPFIITNSWLDAKCVPDDDYGLGYFGFAAGPKVILIDQLGITDKEVALTGKTIWQRVGHNKSISTENVIKRKVLFCSLQNQEYDSIMYTNFFPIINLEPNFLFRLGSQYMEKIQKLKEFYKKIQNSTLAENKKIFEYLKLIEVTYNIEILKLPDQNPPEFKKYDSCWHLKY